MIDDFGTEPVAVPQNESATPSVPTPAATPRVIQWTGHGHDRYHACERTWSMLPGGVYTVDYDDGRIIFVNQPINIDDLFFFPDSVGDQVIQEIETFWDSQDKYAQRGYRHRRGYLLYGPQGSGKSSIVQQMVARITSRGGIVFLCTGQPGFLNTALQNFRSVEPTRPVLCIFEDIDSIIQKHSDKDILSLLDGESQIDYVLNLATTNYPEQLDRRIVSRPRRFDRVIKIGMPSDTVRLAYLQRKLTDATPEELDYLVRASEGFSFAALAEIIISVKCLGNDLENTLTVLKDMHNRNPNSREYDGQSMGFK